MEHALAQRIKPSFIVFTVLGFLISLAIFQFLSNWIAVWAVLYGRPNLGYHNLPPVVHGLQWTLRYALWVFPIIIFGLDSRRRDFTRIAGYGAGLILAILVAFGIFWVRWNETMSGF